MQTKTHTGTLRSSETDTKQLLRKAGLKATPGRMSVLRLLRKAARPLAVRDIFMQLSSPRIDQATAYRILGVLRKSGLVEDVDFRHGHVHYEFKSPIGHHHHIVCERCGRVEDFKGCDYKKIKKNALMQTPLFSEVSRHSLELFGICRRCDK
ncbi:transcriptional repressor [bacterium]|nr:transcriptional repressor [bacterium]MCI0565914.1 transcriptional repressor [bacterium]